MSVIVARAASRSAAVFRIAKRRLIAPLDQPASQVLLGLALAVGLPTIILWLWPENTFEFASGSIRNTMFGAAAALLSGYYLTRKLTAFPGLQVISFILPTFSLTYGLLAAGLLLTRQNYSRFELLASFIVAVAFYHYAFLIDRRARRTRLAVVPLGNVDKLMESTRVDWSIWQSPDELPDQCDGLVADLRAEMGEAWKALFVRCALAGIPVYHSKQVYESLTGQVDIEHLSENSLGSLTPSWEYARLKRGVDVFVAVLILPLASLIWAAAAVLIKLDSRGPVLFLQDRVGYRGKTFRIYKLRTMRVAAEGAHYTEAHDPRVTRVGTFLRKYRIDELPQILNIFKGEMSWIGPRPEPKSMSYQRQSKIPFYSYRYIVRPGITGWAQVNQGYVDDNPDVVKYKLDFDFYYIKNLSLWLDMVIVLKTIGIIVTGFGSR